MATSPTPGANPEATPPRPTGSRRRAVAHRWRVGPAAARKIQERLRSAVRLERLAWPPRTVAGTDVAYDKGEQRAIAGVVLLSFPELKLLEEHWAGVPCDFPYVPGLLSFREAPALLAALRKLRSLPDVIMVDGQGLAHPRRFGLASHLGVLLDLPTLGCAKSRLIGQADEPGGERGCTADLIDDGEVIGAVLRTRPQVAPIFVSVGHRMLLADAVSLALACSPRFRVPEPTRLADQLVSRRRRQMEGNRR